MSAYKRLKKMSVIGCQIKDCKWKAHRFDRLKCWAAWVEHCSVAHGIDFTKKKMPMRRGGRGGFRVRRSRGAA